MNLGIEGAHHQSYQNHHTPSCVGTDENHHHAVSASLFSHKEKWGFVAMVKPIVLWMWMVFSVILMVGMVWDGVQKGMDDYSDYVLLQQQVKDAKEKAQSDQMLLDNKNLRFDKDRLFYKISDQDLKKYVMGIPYASWIDIHLSPREIEHAPALEGMIPLLKAFKTINEKMKGFHIRAYQMHTKMMVENDFFKIIKTLRQNAPFYCVVSDYTFVRKHSFSKNMMDDIKQNGPTEKTFLFEGTVTFFIISLDNDASSLSLDAQRDP